MVVGALVLASTAPPVHAAGFSIFEQGSRAMGMAGAFTAQADDGSAMFHNVGGLAFQNERSFMVGGTFIRNTDSEFRGLEPFPGPSATGELDPVNALVPHVYWVQPLTGTWSFGLSINAPFGLVTEWEDPEDFAGRFLSTRAELRGIDLSPNVALQLTPNFGLGLGAIVRFSDVELDRREAAVDPFTLQPTDVADVGLESDFEQGYGWQIGILHKAHPNFTWGLSYRSAMEIDYDGDARLTQIPTGNAAFDAAVAAETPFDQDLPLTTSVDFPDAASLGLAFRLTRSLLVEVDANWTGWSEFQEVVLDFRDPGLDDEVLPQGYDDSWHYRLGIRLGRADSRNEWRFGYVRDETPQPDEGVGPLLPDADRNGFTVGYGRRGDRLGFDLALMYLPFDERTTTTNRDGFDGTYETTAWLLGGSITW